MAKRLLNCKHIALVIAAALLLTAVLPVLGACKKDPDTGYTLNEYISKFPTTWNTHNGSTDADEYVQGYTEMGLYDFTLSEDRSTYAFIDEMAVGDPKDVTASTTGYGIAAGETGKAWEITLNPDATWENGTKITAEDYVWSMERVLSPEMKNSAASTYITGNYEIYNANNYYNYGTTESYFQILETVYTDEQIDSLIAEGNLFLSLTKGLVYTGFSYSLDAWHTMSPSFYKDETGTDTYPAMQAAVKQIDEHAFVIVGDANEVIGKGFTDMQDKY